MDPSDSPTTIAFLHGLGGDHSSPLSKAGDALWERTGVLPHALPPSLPTSVPRSPSLPSSVPRSTHTVDRYTNCFNRMFYLDHMRKGYREQAVTRMEQLVKGGLTAETEAITQFNGYMQSLSQHIEEVSLMDAGTEGACSEYKEQILRQLQADIALFKSAKSTLQRRVHFDNHTARRVDMGMCCDVLFVC